MYDTKLDRKKEKRTPLTSIYIFSTPKKCSADRVKNRALLGETKATTSVVSPVLVKLRPMYTGAEKKKTKTLYDTPNFNPTKSYNMKKKEHFVAVLAVYRELFNKIKTTFKLRISIWQNRVARKFMAEKQLSEQEPEKSCQRKPNMDKTLGRRSD